MSEAGSSPAADPWWADGLRFTCTRCGACCRGPEPGYVRVGADEIAALAERLELSLDDFGRRYLRRLVEGDLGLTEHPNGDCIFWEDGQGCTVYDVRPTQCRTFPFWPEMLESEPVWDAYAEDCPGMNTGRRYAQARIQRILDGAGQTNRGRQLRRRLKTVD